MKIFFFNFHSPKQGIIPTANSKYEFEKHDKHIHTFSNNRFLVNLSKRCFDIASFLFENNNYTFTIRKKLNN